MKLSEINIRRYPIRKNDLLQGWDSADELLLEHMGALDLDHKKILIVNDHFGAISVGLEQFQPTIYTDSYVSAKAIEVNSGGRLKTLNHLEQLNGIYDYVLIQIPKNISYFEDILCHLSHHIGSESKVICTAMVKHLPKSSFDLLQKYIGETSTSLAKKKARLVFAQFQKKPIHSSYPLQVKLDGFEHVFSHGSNLFSREKLDIGTRFFLEHIPQGNFKTILDLGCANGVVGIRAQQLNPDARLIFCDESFMAVQSAEVNYQNHFKKGAEYIWTNCFEDQPAETLDLVLCNPPFHQHNTLGDFIAWQMFTDAYHVLKPGGMIRIVGNSHLGYQHKLKKIFGNSKLIATNSKFMIVEALKSQSAEYEGKDQKSEPV